MNRPSSHSEKTRSHGLDVAELRAAIRQGLSRLFQIHGRGSRKRALAAAGISPSTFDSALARGSLKIVPLALILQALGTTLAEFFAEGLGQEFQDDKPSGSPPQLVETARERLESVGWEDRLPPERKMWLEELNWYSMEKPQLACNELEKAIRGEHRLSPWFFGVYGSCLWRLGRHREARWVLGLGFEGAGQMRRWHDLAALHQRLAWVECHEGHRRKALDRLALAGGFFHDLGDLQALSQTTIERGVLFALLEEHDLAARAFEAGLKNLRSPGQPRQKEETQYRFFAYRFLTRCHLELGQVREAEESLSRAKEHMPVDEDCTTLLVRALEVEILEAKKWFTAAAEHHRKLAEDHSARKQTEDTVREGLASLRCYLKEECPEGARSQMDFLLSLVLRAKWPEYTKFLNAALAGNIDKAELLRLEKQLRTKREEKLEKKFFCGLY